MGFGTYLRYALGDFAFCVLAAAGLSFTACSAFYATQPLQAYPALIAGAVAVLVAGLFCVNYSARTRVIGGAAYAVCIAGALVACALLGSGEALLDDVEGNYFIFACLIALPSVLVYIVSRTRAGAVVVLVAGAFLCALIEYLYWYGHLIALVVFLAGAIGLVVYRSYQRNLASSDTEHLAFGSVSVVGAVMAAVALALGFGVYALAVQPLDPPRIDMKLVVEYRRVEEVEIVGTGSASDAESGQTGNRANGEQEETDNDQADAGRETVQGGLSSLMGLSDDQSGDAGSTTALSRIVLAGLLIALAIALAVALAVLAKKLYRRRKFANMTAAGGASAVRELYRFFLSRFAKMKIDRPSNLSPAAHAESFSPQFAAFERKSADEQPDFSSLTGIYERVVYGGAEPDDDQVVAFDEYYRSFYGRARLYVGRFKYLFKFFGM